MSEEIKTEEAGTDNNQEEKKQKKSIVTSFMDGAKEGFYIGIENILPARTLCKNCSCSRDKSEIQVASFGAADSSQPGGNAWDARNHDAYGVYVSCFISVNGAAGFD